MRGDVLKLISSLKDVTNVVVLTHNIDFVFLQTVVLSALRKCGHPSVTVFADAGCAAESFVHQAPFLDRLGLRYRVVPVQMEPGFRFHPKAVLLCGETRGTLLVGSGNLTFGGWRENAEIWAQFDSGEGEIGPFAELKVYLEEVLQRIPLNESVAAEISDAFDTRTKRWFVTEGSPEGRTLIGRVGRGAPLLARMMERAGFETVDEAWVCSPYFDIDGRALRSFLGTVSPSRMTVLCQPSGTTLTTRAFAALTGRAILQKISFQHQEASGGTREAFIHAKLYGLRRGTEVAAFLGSANCSHAALTSTGATGNAELLAVRQMDAHMFTTALLGELTFEADAASLRDIPEDDERDDVHSSLLRVLAARFDAGRLWIAYSPRSAEVRACNLDGVAARFEEHEPGILVAALEVGPRAVVLEARVEGLSLRSDPFWVDHENHLRSSARGRDLVEKIRFHLQPGSWTAAAWADVLDVFCKHLAYLRGSASRSTQMSGRATTGEQPARYTSYDVFSDSYDSPLLGGLDRLTIKINGGREHSLQQLLVRWFGQGADEGQLGNADDSPFPSAEGAGEEDDEPVDRPEALVTRRMTVPTAVTQGDRRRIQRILPQVIKAMTSEAFLSSRSPEALAADIKIAAILLRTGLRESWLTPQEICEITYPVWISLFFDGSPEPGLGWIEHRLQNVEDPSEFIRSMRSPDLAAALLGWALATIGAPPSAEAARFELATVLSVARLPWLWVGGADAGTELLALLQDTTDPAADPEALAGAARNWWSRTMRQGVALHQLEQTIGAMKPMELGGRIRRDHLRAGELLWQGSAGYCIVTHASPRVPGGPRVPVLRLQGSTGETSFSAMFTVPVSGLLEEDVLPLDELGLPQREVLRELVGELVIGFGADG